MNYCFIDFEMICPDSGRTMSNTEIISIGAIITDHKFNIIDQFNTIIRPGKNHVVPSRIIELTGITQEMVDSADNFATCFNRFGEWLKPYKVYQLITWGNFDSFGLICSFRNNKYKGPYKYLVNKIYDIQPIVSESIIYKQKPVTNEWSLLDACKIYGITNQLKNHNALDDAIMLSLVFKAYVTKQPYTDFLKYKARLINLRKEKAELKNLENKIKQEEDNIKRLYSHYINGNI